MSIFDFIKSREWPRKNVEQIFATNLPEWYLFEFRCWVSYKVQHLMRLYNMTSVDKTKQFDIVTWDKIWLEIWKNWRKTPQSDEIAKQVYAIIYKP